MTEGVGREELISSYLEFAEEPEVLVGVIAVSQDGLTNDCLRQGRRRLGWRQKDLADMAGVSSGYISQLEQLRIYPTDEVARRVSEALGGDKNQFFPDWLRAWQDFSSELKDEDNSIKIIPINETPITQLERAWQMDQTSAPVSNIVDPTEFSNRREIIDALNNSLDTLSPREKEVVIYRFVKNMTLSEIGGVYGLQGERIRQIEAKALSKLRHPSRSKLLIGFTSKVDKQEEGSQNMLFNGVLNAIYQGDCQRAFSNIEAIERSVLEKKNSVNRGLVELIYESCDSCGWSDEAVEQILEAYRQELDKTNHLSVKSYFRQFNPALVCRSISELRPIWQLKKQAEELSSI